MSEKNLDSSIIKPAPGSVEGITEVRRQKALLKTGALQNAILNSANFSSIATDENGVIQIFNVGAERMLGYMSVDVLNKITPADISDPQEVIARAEALSVELGTPITPGFEALVFKASRGIEDIYELTYIRKDGSRFPAIVSVTALRDAQGGIIGYLLIGTDNTARKLVEAERQRLLEIQEETNKQQQQQTNALQASEERLAVTLNSIGDAVIATDAEARITLMNPLAEQLTGWTQVSAAGRPVDEIFHIVNKATRQPAAIPVMETLAHGTIQGLANHTVLIARDGSECDIADSCAPIRDRDAQMIGAVLVFRDVSGEYAVQHTLQVQQVELELQNEELRDSQMALSILRTRYFDLYNLAPMGYCTLSEQGQILEANITAATLLGLTKGLVKPPIFRFIFKEDADIYYRLHERLTKTDELQTGELRMVKADGTPAWVQLSISAAQDNDTPVIRIVMMDISERKRTEEALFKASALQNAIFNSANFSSIATDAKGVIQIFNVGAEHMLGYTAADVMNKITPAEISDPQEVIARAKALSVELGTPIEPGFEALVFKASRGIEDIYELTYIRKDGSRFPAVVSVTALRDAQDTIIGYLLIGTEIKAGALQSAIFNSANFSSIATDAKGVIQIFNVGAERMLGYTAAEVMNKITPAEISDPQEVVARAKALSVELGTPIEPGFEALVFKASRGIEDIYELTYIRKDGSRFPAVVSVTALRDAQNAIIGYLLIGTDNSARKQVEEQLRWTEESFRLMVESVTDYAIVMLDPEGRVVSWNSGAQRIKGYSAEEIVGQHFSRFYPLEDIERGTPQRDLDIVTARGRFEDEGWRVRKNGSTFWANVVYTAIRDQSGNLRGYAKLTRDLTERKRLDQELERAKSVAEKANLAKSDFLSSMSHELRTPLNAILGFAQLLEAGSPPPTDAQKIRLHQIIKAGWYLLELINEILDLALIESGKLSLSREPVALIDVIIECQAMIEPQAQQRDIKLTFIPFDETWFASADRTRVKQVLINLLSNAIKYNREHGTVEVKCIESTPERLRISVKDTGEGLAPEKLAQLFQPFNRLGQESSGKEGTGIGLVVTKQLVELMGGAIGVESTVGVGSEFWIDLLRDVTPQLAAGNAMSSEPALQTQENATPRILLYVEDNPANLMLVEQIIESHPQVRMLSARDGNLGIALARAHLPDVILMDINLPGISGIQALKILRKDPATMHIPVVAISANAMPRDIEKGLEAGFFRYLTKPIQVNEFMNALDDALKLSEIGLVNTNKTDKYDD
ncbi:PAS domain S-box protein [Methylobacter tundripaludum]|uniref:histidine kinase n=1 Tax=Methylobacter tundripaludum (strain ATCC BAA-1195 / DSM 17260 / SV96) TaxID=697282 RepID=G3IVP3_METTV|nr:PAS domain S-box protein [Methylobacter tundripaludum]EGW21780.1 PAS/PAC sensor hybrid histidine kinase [Methylobacter tundripaludum SV96]